MFGGDILKILKINLLSDFDIYLGYVIYFEKSWAKRESMVRANVSLLVIDDPYVAQLVVSEDFEKYVKEKGFEIVNRKYLEFHPTEAELMSSRVDMVYEASNVWDSVDDFEDWLVKKLSMDGLWDFRNGYWEKRKDRSVEG